ncbi:MAG: hypothetical protein IPK80_25250 [Nannocystis sp.]|nr:hypothetical protein [Nannocystis sp.]
MERASTAEVLAKVEATAMVAKADAEAARKELAQALRAGAHATKESKGLREQLEVARKELAEALRSGGHATKESKGLREQLEAARKELAQALRSGAQAMAESKGLHEKVEAARKELAEALRAGAQAMAESKGLRGQLEGAWEEVEAVRAAADAEVRRRRDAEETIAGLRVRVGALEGERNTWGAQRDRMTRELEASQRELEQLRPSADQVAALKAKLVELRREIAQSRDAHDQTRLQEQRALAALTKERDELQIALVRAQEVVQYKSVEVIVVRRHMSRVDPERLKREIEENLERVREGR